jgi:uncharacterized Rmd1/YagE family protein
MPQNPAWGVLQSPSKLPGHELIRNPDVIQPLALTAYGVQKFRRSMILSWYLICIIYFNVIFTIKMQVVILFDILEKHIISK